MKNTIIPLLWLLLILTLCSCEKTEPLPSDANEVFNSPLSPSTFDYTPFDDPTVPFYVNAELISDPNDDYEIQFEFSTNSNYNGTLLSIDWSVDANFFGYNDCQDYSTSYSTINPSITIPQECDRFWLVITVDVDYDSGKSFTYEFSCLYGMFENGTILTLVLP